MANSKSSKKQRKVKCPELPWGSLCLLIAGWEAMKDVQRDSGKGDHVWAELSGEIFSKSLTYGREGFGNQDDFSVWQQYRRGQQNFMTMRMFENYVLHLGTFASWAEMILKRWPVFLAPPDPHTRSCRSSEHVHWRTSEVRIWGSWNLPGWEGNGPESTWGTKMNSVSLPNCFSCRPSETSCGPRCPDVRPYSSGKLGPILREMEGRAV